MLSSHYNASIVSSSSMLGSVDDSDGSDGEAAMFRPSKKLQLSTIAHLTLPASGCSTPRPSQQPKPSIYYMMPTGWYEKWEAYCSFPKSRYPPGPIEMKGLSGMIGEGKAVEHCDYVVIQEEAWSLLVEWYGLDGEAIQSKHAPSWSADLSEITCEIEGESLKLNLPSNATNAHVLGTLVKLALQRGVKNPGNWAVYENTRLIGQLADQIGEQQVAELGNYLIMVHQ